VSTLPDTGAGHGDGHDSAAALIVPAAALGAAAVIGARRLRQPVEEETGA
jgi:metal-dependent amidase/aminoacylase/carboxypeptidase family protein